MLVNQTPHQLDLWQWICGLPRSVCAKVGYGFRRAIAVEDEVTAVVDYGGGATGGEAVPFDFDEDDYLNELNRRIREEGSSRRGRNRGLEPQLRELSAIEILLILLYPLGQCHARRAHRGRSLRPR